MIQSSSCGGYREHVSICLDCGQMTVSATDLNKGASFEVEFGLNCDTHLRAAARYMRSDAGAADALTKATQKND